MEIKNLTLDDVEEVFLITKSQFKNESWTKQQIYDGLNDNSYLKYGIFIDGKLVSYVLALKTIDDINILLVATKSEYLHKGYASSLITYLQKIAVENKITVSLEVKNTNIKALNLYKKLGFNIISTRKNYYKDNSDALIMFFNLQI